MDEDNNNINDQPSSSHFTPRSSARRRTPSTRYQRSSSAISVETSTGSRRGSATRGGVSKSRVSRGSRATTTGKEQTARQTTASRRSAGSHAGSNREIEANVDINDSDEPTGAVDGGNPLNLSSASADTGIDQHPPVKRKENNVMEYFTLVESTRKFKCSICAKVKQRKSRQRETTITPQTKKCFDKAAIQCIIDDGHTFGIFRRDGMQQFLSTAIPGYYGPSRKTVRKHLDKLYRERRAELIETFKKIEHIALTTDLWVNSRRSHFLAITAHYYDEQMRYSSIVISFRRFQGRHLAVRLKAFIAREIEKLNIMNRIVSITSDNGSDIKAATSTYRFGTRYSCAAHNLNLTISTGLGLWKKQKPKSKKQATPANTTRSTADSDQELDEIRLVDHDRVPDDCSAESSSASEDEDSDSIASDDTSTSSSESSSSEEEEDLASPQRERHGEESQEQQELNNLLSNPDELKKKIYQLLQRTRKLISMIHKSSILTTFVRDEGQRRQNNLNGSDNSITGKKVKINEVVKDFHVRWNSTYLMLNRLLAVQPIVNDITYTPQAHIGLKIKQIKKLRSLINTHFDWELLQSLANVLAPFHLATLCLSGRQYPTLALSYWIEQNLHAYLSTRVPEAPLENALRHLLLTRFDLYFTSKASREQKAGKLIAAYLDPFTFAELSIDAINEAELLMVNDMSAFGQITHQLNQATISSQLPQQRSAVLSSHASSASASARRSSATSIQQFKMSCNHESIAPLVTPGNAHRHPHLSIKEEFSFYMSKHKESKDFQSFWNDNQSTMPFLSSFVRRCSVIPATSIASESAFSIAGYIQRKQRASLSPSTLRYLMLLKK